MRLCPVKILYFSPLWSCAAYSDPLRWKFSPFIPPPLVPLHLWCCFISLEIWNLLSILLSVDGQRGSLISTVAWMVLTNDNQSSLPCRHWNKSQEHFKSPDQWSGGPMPDSGALWYSRTRGEEEGVQCQVALQIFYTLKCQQCLPL